MSTVFIGGSRKISRLPAEVIARIDRMIAQDFGIVVGDANGADKAVQSYLASRSHPRVEVFCSGDSPRNNVGRWPVRAVAVPRGARGFAFYTVKDRVMADEADYGLMIWDGESVGTLVNVARLARLGKKAVLYDSQRRDFVELRRPEDWEMVTARCSPELRDRVEAEAADTSLPRPAAPATERQPALFGEVAPLIRPAARAPKVRPHPRPATRAKAG